MERLEIPFQALGARFGMPTGAIRYHMTLFKGLQILKLAMQLNCVWFPYRRTVHREITVAKYTMQRI